MTEEGTTDLEALDRRLETIDRSLRSRAGIVSGGSRPNAGRLRTLGLMLTEACNLRCEYCYQNRKRDRRMSWDVLRSSLDLLLDSGNPRLTVAFFGGEPLLEMALIRRAVEYAERRRPPASRLLFEVSTNGTLLRRETIRFFARHRVRTEISFDGVRQAQDVRGPRTFAVLDDLLGQLSTTEPAFFRSLVGARLTVGSHNVEHLADSASYFIDRGVRSISMSTLMTHDRGWRTRMIEELDRQFERITAESLSHYRRTGELPVTALRYDAGKPTEAEGIPMCGVRWGDRMTVDVDGDATACVAFSGKNQEFPSRYLAETLSGLDLGSIFDRELSERLESFPAALRRVELFRDKQNKYSSYGECRHCAFVRSCHICPVSIGYIPGNTDPRRVPDSVCAFNLVANTHTDRFLAEIQRAAG